MKNTVADIQHLKKNSAPFSTVTVYDYPTSLIINDTNIPMVLVGDSASMVVYGYDNTIPITMDELILITKSVNRGIQKALIVADMPFMSYQPSTEAAIKNAGQLIKFGGADAIKLEGGREYVDRIEKIIESGVPVMGHLGLKPQSILTDSGYKIHGKNTIDAMRIYKDALALEKAGVFAIVLEGVPIELAEIITQKVQIPTVGIGAGNKCDGQIQVFHDLIGAFNQKIPKHAKKYINNYEIIKEALVNYCDQVENKIFPHKINAVKMDSNELKSLQKNIEDT
jgi:3-methyl-2-oxobutanoate hydroxymethyltransferase|tara:strand:- start:1149 stop:1994 length:846 start_codon:yes stop_codon:yes gene_type:complete